MVSFKLLKQPKSTLVVSLIILFIFCLPLTISAVDLTSLNYKISNIHLPTSAGLSQSNSYNLSLMIGQDVVGSSTSTNYKLFLGNIVYESDIDEYFCISPPWYWDDKSYGGTDDIDNDSLDGLCCGDDYLENYVGTINKPNQLADGTDACCEEPTDCVISDSCIASELDTTDMVDLGELSCYNAGLYRGFCGDASWQRSPDDSADACCCLSDGYWDADPTSSNPCCDAGDDWTSSDGKWTCTDGVVSGNYTGDFCSEDLNLFQPDVVFTVLCDEQEIDGVKRWWNDTDWVSESPSRCGCTQNLDCNQANNESCIQNVCVEKSAPTISFIPSGLLSLQMGDTRDIVLIIKNYMDITDNVDISIDKSLTTISDWLWFKGQKNMNPYTKTVVIPPNSDVSVILQVMGGKTGLYTIAVEAKSQFTLDSSLKMNDIRIIPTIDAGAVGTTTTTTPGLSWVSFLLVLVISLLIYPKKGFSTKR